MHGLAWTCALKYTNSILLSHHVVYSATHQHFGTCRDSRYVEYYVLEWDWDLTLLKWLCQRNVK